MAPSSRIGQYTEQGHTVLSLPADLTPVLELGWLVGAGLLVLALLPAALLKSALVGVAGVLGVGTLAALLLYRLRVRLRTQLTLTPDALLIQTGGTRQAIPLAHITAVTIDRIGGVYLPALRGLSEAERGAVRRTILAHAQRVTR